MVEKYCEGIACQYCSEKEPCIYKLANRQAKIIEEIKEIAETKQKQSVFVGETVFEQIL